MPRYTETKITLSAGQAAGTTAILLAETGAVGQRTAVLVGNPTVTDMNLHLATGGATGSGLPLNAKSIVAFDQVLPGLNNNLFVTGGAAGDKITVWTA